MDSCMGGRMDACMDGWIRKFGWIEGWRGEWIDRWMDGQMGGWMNGWMDR